MNSEEGLMVIPHYTVDELTIDLYDSLLLPGQLIYDQLIEEPRYTLFVQQFNQSGIIIGSISSSTVLLLQSGILQNQDYMTGVSEKYFNKLGFRRENLITDAPYVHDGTILTAKGSGFVEFGIEFGNRLGLEFNADWYQR